MNHPYESKFNANLKYNQMLKDADAYRKVQRITGERPSLFKALVALFSGLSKVERNEAVASGTSKAGTIA